MRILSILKKHSLFFLLLLSTFLATYKVWDKTVIFTDELFIEDAAYTMAHGGSWIIPTVNGGAYLAKPPLLYWLTAPLYWFFPPQPWVRRIWMVIFGVGTVAVTYALTKKWYGQKPALWAGILLATSTPFIYFTKTGNWDLVNAFFITLSIYFYNLSKQKPHYLILTSLSLALGILNRSFLALIPIPVIIGDYMIFSKRKFSLSLIFSFCSLILLIVLPWHLLAYHQAPQEFINQYIKLPLNFHAMNIVPGDTPSSPLFYLSIFFFFPPIVFALIQFLFFIKQKLTSSSLQLLTWISIYLAFLLISKTRHEWYILPLIPPLAILAGVFISQRLTFKFQTLKQFLLVLFIIPMMTATPLALLLPLLPQAETITAVEIFKKQSQSADILYLYRYPLIPITRFYPDRIVKIINNEALKSLVSSNSSLFLLIRPMDQNDLSTINIATLLYRSSEIELVKITP